MISPQIRRRIQKEYQKLRSYTETAKKCGVGRSTVQRVINNIDRKTKKAMGRPKKLNTRVQRSILRHVKSELRLGRQVTARKIIEDLGLELCRRTIQLFLKDNNVFYKAIQKKLPLSVKHREARMNFARLHLLQKTDFRCWIFSDEKRFSLDGPDNFMSYVTEDHQLERLAHQNKGGSIMLLGAIAPNGKYKLKVVSDKYKAVEYKKDLEETFFPWISSIFPRQKWWWQQDNAPIHTAKIITEMFNMKNINYVQWPARSPDLSPIENYWSILQAKVYENGQYHDKATLEANVIRCASKISPSVIKKLFLTMDHRLIKVIERNGGEID